MCVWGGVLRRALTWLPRPLPVPGSQVTCAPSPARKAHGIWKPWELIPGGPGRPGPRVCPVQKRWDGSGEWAVLGSSPAPPPARGLCPRLSAGQAQQEPQLLFRPGAPGSAGWNKPSGGGEHGPLWPLRRPRLASRPVSVTSSLSGARASSGPPGEPPRWSLGQRTAR